MENPLIKEKLLEKIKKNETVSTANTSLIDDMHNLFIGNYLFNQPLNNWDVSKVKYMQSMFWGATNFNQPLNDWDVSNVKDMEGMFRNAKNYTYSFKTWKLKSDCKIDDFLTDCNLWHLFNTVEDLPMKNGERIDIGDIGDRKTWNVL